MKLIDKITELQRIIDEKSEINVSFTTLIGGIFITCFLWVVYMVSIGLFKCTFGIAMILSLIPLAKQLKAFYELSK